MEFKTASAILPCSEFPFHPTAQPLSDRIVWERKKRGLVRNIRNAGAQKSNFIAIDDPLLDLITAIRGAFTSCSLTPVVEFCGCGSDPSAKVRAALCRTHVRFNTLAWSGDKLGFYSH